jgi:putative flavoprotein involved in K+ transport
MSAKADVIVVGGGPAGLSTGAALARRGIAARILDRGAEIGSSWGSRYDALHLHTIRRFSGLAHYPIANDRPRYLSKDEYAAYLEEYARAFDLDVELGAEVRSVSPLDIAGSSLWQVGSGAGSQQARVVVMATGLYAMPRMPGAVNADSFAGTVLHSSAYRNPAPFAGQRVLVVGLGNSGAEIAADLARSSVPSVCVAMRDSPPIVSREMMGLVPVQLFGLAFANLGLPGVLDRLSARLRRLSLGDLTRYGLRDADWGTFATQRPALIDTGFLHELKRGRVAIRTAVTRLDGNCVFYDDGSEEEVDVVIAATGYGTGLERIFSDAAPIDQDGQPRQLGRTPAAPGLYFVGFKPTVRGQLFEINCESRQAAAAIERYLGQ